MRSKTTSSLRGSVELANFACREFAERFKLPLDSDPLMSHFFNLNIAQPLARAQEKIDRISESKKRSMGAKRALPDGTRKM